MNKRTGTLLRPDMGHADAPEHGHSVDKPYNDVGKAMNLAHIVYNKLLDAKFLDRDAPVRSFEFVKSRLEELFSASPGRVDQMFDSHAAAKGEEQLRSDMWKLAILLEFGDDVDYEQLAPPNWWIVEFEKRAADQRSFVLNLEGLIEPWDFGFEGSVTVTAEDPGIVCGFWGCVTPKN